MTPGAEALSSWVRRTRNDREVSPRVSCRDGFSMSVQASRFAYSLPRNDTGPWSHLEVGFPSEVEPLLWQWAESPGDWTGTVYPYTPVAWILAVIELHGGSEDLEAVSPPTPEAQHSTRGLEGRPCEVSLRDHDHLGPHLQEGPRSAVSTPPDAERKGHDEGVSHDPAAW